MFPYLPFRVRIPLAAAVAFLITLLMTPPVKHFAERMGAIDMPSERRINKTPIPRMGGLAIFFGFMAAILLFVDISTYVVGIILGSIIIVAMGAVDDISNLSPLVKLAFQVIAALVAMRFGIVFNAISNLNFISDTATLYIGSWLAYPLTLIWIVGCTNAVNLIDGLDGLAVGVSAISAITMMVVSILVSNRNVTLILGCLVGACVGFMPYNFNPAKIFMGDVGSQLLGFVLACASVAGLFKLHALITFLVPLMALAVPLADTLFAFFRRILHGQSPFKADKGHFHHRLLASGLSQKQAVAVLYGVSAVMGLFAVLLAGDKPAIRIGCIAGAFIIALFMWLFIFKKNPHLKAGPVSPQSPEPPQIVPDESDSDIKIYTKGGNKQ